MGRVPAASRHIAVIAPPTPGHFNPLQALGLALVDHGHRVTMVHVAEAARFVTAPGIGFAGLPGSGAGGLAGYLDRLADPTGMIGLTRMIRATAAMTGRLLDDAPDLLRAIGADAVIADSAEPAGALIARRIGVPHIASITGLPLFGEPDVPPPFLGWRYRADRIGRFRNRGGYAVADVLLRPITRVVRARRRAWRLEGDAAPYLSVAQCPRGLDYPRSTASGLTYGAPWRSAEGETVDLPEDGRPLVFCSLGTLQGARRRLFAAMAQACATVGARAVIGHGGGLSAVEAAALPGDPLVRAFWPQRAVLRRCRAAVLHGGFNTVLDALAAGVPIVALPIAFEQPGTAARLVRIGVGRALSPRGLTADRLSVALADVMRNPGYGQAAARLAAEMGGGGATRAAALVSAALAGSC